jgi:ATP-binding protein involved in chromosome partitioning
MNEEIIREALKSIPYPGFSRDIVSFGIVRDIAVEGRRVSVKLALTTADESVPAKLREACERALGNLSGVNEVSVEIAVSKPQIAKEQSGKEPLLPGVKAIIAIASGKGGVGKSTVSVNLACAIDSIIGPKGGKTGILDCDIYGPSIPLMLGSNNRPGILNGKIMPEEARGLRIMSMGLLLDDDSPVVWRGPMVTSAITQFMRDVDWGDLDVLVVDLPPGTGDAQLALVQNIPVTGAVIVTTPQTAAVNVARRGAKMFAKVNVPILGVIENMSYFLMPDGEKNYIFGKGGGAIVAKALDSTLLAEIPIDPVIRAGCDSGLPSILSDPEIESSLQFSKAAKAILDTINHR